MSDDVNDTHRAMTAEELIGVWGFDHGYRDTPDEARLTFEPGGIGYVSQGKTTRTPFRWRLGSAGLELSFTDGRWNGPYEIYTKRTTLPMGEFTTLVSSKPLLPFGLKIFQRIDGI